MIQRTVYATLAMQGALLVTFCSILIPLSVHAQPISAFDVNNQAANAPRQPASISNDEFQRRVNSQSAKTTKETEDRTDQRLKELAGRYQGSQSTTRSAPPPVETVETIETTTQNPGEAVLNPNGNNAGAVTNVTNFTPMTQPAAPRTNNLTPPPGSAPSSTPSSNNPPPSQGGNWNIQY